MCIRDRHDTLFRGEESITKVAALVKSFIDMGGHQTVSYTHLDVYKRQKEIAPCFIFSHICSHLPATGRHVNHAIQTGKSLSENAVVGKLLCLSLIHI